MDMNMEVRGVKEGGVYILKDGCELYKNPIFNHCLVMVVNKNKGYAKVILIDRIPKEAESEYRVPINCVYMGKTHRCLAVCDMISYVKYEYFKEKIYFINDEVMGKIKEKVFEKERKDSENTIIETAIKNAKLIEHLKSIIEQAYAKLEETSSSTNQTKAMIEESKKPINIWKERGIGFVFGVLASMMATFIYENTDTIINFTINIWNIFMENVQNF